MDVNDGQQQQQQGRGYFRLEDDRSELWFEDDDLQVWFVYRENAITPSGITHVLVEEGVKRIPRNEFRNCSLRHVKLARSVESIGDSAFINCGKLVRIDIPENSRLREIESHTFKYCKSLRSITLPASLQRIGEESFFCCSALKVEISPGSQLQTIEGGSFYFCTKLKKIDLANCLNLTRIGSGAFCGCSRLREISWPKNLETIEEKAFWNCQQLTTIEFQSLQRIHLDVSLFRGCTSLHKLRFPAEDYAARSLSLWPDLLFRLQALSWLMGPDGCTEEQRISCCYSFLKSNIEDLNKIHEILDELPYEKEEKSPAQKQQRLV
mmetsp:Transcript_2897/g.7419  ORF Transcript_2897/g.7419 Transcript_2897/m.7419 type:complete len:323 (-) Transcript_2897:229-1197(-)